MNVKTFRGKSMADVLRQVKQQFGPNAVILTTRMSGRRGLLGVGGPSVEMTAAPTVEGLPKPLQHGRLQANRRSTEVADGAACSVSDSSKKPDDSPSLNVLAELGTLKGMVADLARETRRAHSPEVPQELFELYSRLVQNEVAEQLARELVDRAHRELGPDRLKEPRAVRGQLARYIEAMLPTAGPIRPGSNGSPRIVALVGPTGVGKTTTVAKLAAHFCLRERRKVGLITIDTYRIAAVEQLRTYARIIEVPLEVVMTPESLRDAISRLGGCDLILIDTAGRSQRDSVRIEELKRFFAAVKPSEVHLVLSGTVHESVITETIDRFRDVGVDRIIFTKLDEAVGFGVMLSCLSKADARLSYLTHGQDVPDDIAVADSRTLAGRIVGDIPVISQRRR